MTDEYNPAEGTMIKILVKMKGKQILSGIETYGFDDGIQDRMTVIGVLENLKQQEIKKLNDVGSISKSDKINKDDL